MNFLTTAAQRFAHLPDYPFAAHFLKVSDCSGGWLRMHYVDEGERGAQTILMLHGEPSWSYLYRNMIKPMVSSGFRVIAPDLIGFGKSDKPVRQQDYSYQRHVDWLRTLLTQLDLHDLTLVCQDWGGLLGLRLVAEHADRFARVLAANTMLPTCDHAVADAFWQWRTYAQQVEEFSASGIIQRATVRTLDAATLNAYDAPFPDESYKAGARQFPLLVPVTPDDPASEANRQAWLQLRQFNKPFLTTFSDSDPITAGGDAILQKLIPGCQGQAHTTINQAGHFLQEDQAERLCQVLLTFMQSNPLPQKLTQA